MDRIRFPYISIFCTSDTAVDRLNQRCVDISSVLSLYIQRLWISRVYLCGLTFGSGSSRQLNGTGWAVQGGRKDGLFSCAEAAELELPPPTFNVSQLIESFARRGLSKKQMVILSGPLPASSAIANLLVITHLLL